MLVTLKEVLKIAEEKGIAVGAFNAANLESLQAVLTAAEELHMPVILQFAQCHESWVPLELIGPVMVAEAKKASVPVCVHLDHGETFDYLEKALAIGFTGIMYDGSVLPYEENLENTKKAVAMAARTGASVEAELGSMGKRESGAGDSDGDDTKIYTDPEQAKAFVEASGIDALACSFGTTHGIYLTTPKLDFDVVKNVRALTGDIPVVMHGGSGTPDDQMREAVRRGISKVNIFSDILEAYYSAMRDFLNSQQNLSLWTLTAEAAAVDALKAKVKEKLLLLGADGRV